MEGMVLQELWNWMSPVHDQIWSLLFTLLVGVIYWIFRRRVKLVWGMSSNSIHFPPAENEKIEIYAEKYYVQNVGKKPAHNIEIVMTYRPDDVSLYQPRDHKENMNPNGKFIISIPFIAPGELVVLDVLYISKRAAVVESVKCDEALGKQVGFVTNRRFGHAFNFTAIALFFLGIAFLVQTIGHLILG
ncbi:hypothetical protein [Hoeflea sp.]|uniref:hypothetical protein n=1 Tax=Hoeflea sp. TaxID=1940281 RepID=UPI003A93A120